MPNGKFRLCLVARKPVAAALQFERAFEVITEHVIEWDCKRKRPRKEGGLFGIPKAWLRFVEEQSRLTLHAHFLIWIEGHEDLQAQLEKADAARMTGSFVTTGAEDPQMQNYATGE